MNNLRIVFMEPQIFATALQALVENNYNVTGVITVPDKPAGRGQNLRRSSVKEYALQKHSSFTTKYCKDDGMFFSRVKIFRS